MKELYSLRSLLIALIVSISAANCFSQVGINTTGAIPDNSAILDIDATGMSPKKGLLIPRMTTGERTAIISAAEGLQIYNTTTKCLEIYVGGTWQPVTCACTSAPAASGAISGSAIVCPGQNAVLYAVPSIAGATSYTWAYTGSGIATSGSTNPVIINFASNATSGILTVTGTNACGNGTVSANYGITVNSSTPVITTQPVSATICFGAGAPSFTVEATGSSFTYRWQEYISSWNDILNSGVYSGATTATLTITNATTSMSDHQYRCVLSTTCAQIITDGEATLTVHPVPAVTNTPLAQSVCPGISTTLVNLASDVAGATFSWSATATPGISNFSTSGTSTIPAQTLTNSNSTAGTVTYAITPTANGCTGAVANYVITANPPIPSTPTATAATGVGSTRLTANWNAASGATSYLLDVSTVSNFSSFVGIYYGLDVGNVLTYNITGLSVSTLYYYRVRAVNSCGASGNSAFISATTTNITANIVSYWKLDEGSGNANSSVGSNTLTNYGTAAYGAGKINNGIDYGTSNTSKWLEITNGIGMTNSSAYTWSGWVKMNTEISSAQQSIIEWTPGGASGSRISSGIQYVYTSGNRGLIFYRYRAGGSSPEYSEIRNNVTLGTSNWTFVTATYNGSGNMEFFVNGISVGTATDHNGGGTAYAVAGFAVGAYAGTGGSGGDYINGIIDEVGVWSRVLTSAEITQLYNSGAGLQYPF